MVRFEYLFAVLLGSAYVLLATFLSGITATWGDLISSNDFWGQSNATAVAHMQIHHSIGVGLAALPVALAITFRYKANWLRPTFIVAIIGSLYVLFDAVRGVWLLSQAGLSPESYHLVSSAIDVAKVGLIVFGMTAILNRFLSDRLLV